MMDEKRDGRRNRPARGDRTLFAMWSYEYSDVGQQKSVVDGQDFRRLFSGRTDKRLQQQTESACETPTLSQSRLGDRRIQTKKRR